MTPQIAPRVEDFIADPSDREIELIIRVKESDKEQVLSEIEDYGAEHIRDLPLDCILISAPGHSIEDISNIPNIQRIEENAEFEEFDSGNW